LCCDVNRGDCESEKEKKRMAIKDNCGRQDWNKKGKKKEDNNNNNIKSMK